MIVRGGDPGQNLYLFDNVPVIYVNHLGGFMSVFNPEIINNIDVYKGGFPSRYGGKLSSVMDITQRKAITLPIRVRSMQASRICPSVLKDLPELRIRVS
jgi:hypothetical protein